MIKKLLSLLTIFLISSSCVFALDYNQDITPEVASGIRKYKAGNYVGCLQDMSNYIKKNIEKGGKNQLAMYYMGMAYTQSGREDNAKYFYNYALKLNPNNTIGQYAQKGLVCIENPENCYINEKEEVKPEEKLSELDKFIKAPYGNGLSSDLNKELERKKVERLRKEMNSDQELNKYEFKDFRDFSIKKNNNNQKDNGKKTSFNLNNLKIAQGIKGFYAQHDTEGIKIVSSSNPTDAEIVEALRVLNAAGLTNIAKQAENTQTKEEVKPSVSEVKSEYKPDVTREEYQQQIQREMMQAQMAAMSQPNIDALFGGNNNNNQNNMMNSNMMNMLPFMMAQQATQNANGANQQQMMSPEMMQTMMFNSMMPNMNFGLGGNN